MGAMIWSALKVASWITGLGGAYLTVKESVALADAVARAAKWGAIGGAIYFATKLLKVIK